MTCSGRLRTHVAVGEQPDPVRARRFDLLDARNGLSRSASPSPFGLDLDTKAAAEHLTAEFADGAEQRDLTGVEQRDAVAHALHPIEQMRRQQHRDAVDA